MGNRTKKKRDSKKGGGIDPRALLNRGARTVKSFFSGKDKKQDSSVLQQISILVSNSYHETQNPSNISPQTTETLPDEKRHLPALSADVLKAAYNQNQLAVLLSMLAYAKKEAKTTVPVVCGEQVFRDFAEKFIHIDESSFLYDGLTEMKFNIDGVFYEITMESHMVQEDATKPDPRISVFGVLEALYHGYMKNKPNPVEGLRPRSNALTEEPTAVGPEITTATAVGPELTPAVQMEPPAWLNAVSPEKPPPPPGRPRSSINPPPPMERVLPPRPDRPAPNPPPKIMTVGGAQPPAEPYDVFVSPLLRHWMTAVCLFLSEATGSLRIIVSPFLMEKATLQKFEHQTIKFHFFLNFLLELSEAMEPQTTNFFDPDPQVQQSIKQTLDKLKTFPVVVVQKESEAYEFSVDPKTNRFVKKAKTVVPNYFEKMVRLDIVLDDFELVSGPVKATSYKNEYLADYARCDQESVSEFVDMRLMNSCMTQERQNFWTDCFKNFMNRRAGTASDKQTHGMIYRNHEYVQFFDPGIIKAMMKDSYDSINEKYDTKFDNPYAPLYMYEGERISLNELNGRVQYGHIQQEEVNRIIEETKKADKTAANESHTVRDAFMEKYKCFLNSLVNIPFAENDLFEIFSLWKTIFSRKLFYNLNSYFFLNGEFEHFRNEFVIMIETMDWKTDFRKRFQWFPKVMEKLGSDPKVRVSLSEDPNVSMRTLPQDVLDEGFKAAKKAENLALSNPNAEQQQAINNTLDTNFGSATNPGGKELENAYFEEGKQEEQEKMDKERKFNEALDELGNVKMTMGGAGTYDRSIMTKTQIEIMKVINRVLDINDILYDRSYGVFSPYFQKREACIILMRAIAFFKQDFVKKEEIANFIETDNWDSSMLTEEENGMVFKYKEKVIDPHVQEITEFFEKNKTQLFQKDSSKKTLNPTTLSLNPSEIGSPEMVSKDYTNKIRNLVYKLVQILEPMIKGEDKSILSDRELKRVDFNKTSHISTNMKIDATGNVGLSWTSNLTIFKQLVSAAYKKMVQDKFEAVRKRNQGMTDQEKGKEEWLDFSRKILNNTLMSPHFICSSAISNLILIGSSSGITSTVLQPVSPLSVAMPGVLSNIFPAMTISSSSLVAPPICLYANYLVAAFMIHFWGRIWLGKKDLNMTDPGSYENPLPSLDSESDSSRESTTSNDSRDSSLDVEDSDGKDGLDEFDKKLDEIINKGVSPNIKSSIIELSNKPGFRKSVNMKPFATQPIDNKYIP
jgi:hypothetical protein